MLEQARSRETFTFAEANGLTLLNTREKIVLGSLEDLGSRQSKKLNPDFLHQMRNIISGPRPSIACF